MGIPSVLSTVVQSMSVTRPWHIFWPSRNRKRQTEDLFFATALPRSKSMPEQSLQNTDLLAGQLLRTWLLAIPTSIFPSSITLPQENSVSSILIGTKPCSIWQTRWSSLEWYRSQKLLNEFKSKS